MRAIVITNAFQRIGGVKTARELDTAYQEYFGPQGILNKEYHAIQKVKGPSRRGLMFSFIAFRKNLLKTIEDKRGTLNGTTS